MKNELIIRLKINEAEAESACAIGTRVGELVPLFGDTPSPIVAARVNDEIVTLSARLEVNASIEPVLLDSPEGEAVYRCSLSFLLAIAAKEIFPERGLYVGHSLGPGYYYTFLDGRRPGPGEVEKLEGRMRLLAAEDHPITCCYMAYAEAMEAFTKSGQDDTALLLAERSESKVLVNECAGFVDLCISPLVNRIGLLQAFELMPYENGFLLRFPAIGSGHRLEPFEDEPNLFAVYEEHKKWGRIVGVHSVGRLNRLVTERAVREYIRIAEAFHDKKIAEIALEIYNKRGEVKAVLIAGPSSSGKTTSAKRLSIALKVMGIQPIAVSLDDYYVGTDKTPLDEKGEPDFECLEALDVPYLNGQLLDLLAGKEITLPSFDFKVGRRKEGGGKKIHLDDHSMLIIEGIHGLNDALTPQIKRETKFKLYVSALTQLNLDDHNRIPTSDNRLLRRLVRDYQFRGAGATRTFQMWPSVQRGERKHIFPFQNQADATLNSALDYELAVLKVYADPLLRSVKPGMKEYSEAARLLSFLANFTPILPHYVPGTSILREFIGESEFKY